LHQALGTGQFSNGLNQVNTAQRAIVTSIVSSTNAFALVPKNQVFDHALVVIPFEDYGLFAVLQSSIHFAYAWQHGGKMKSDLRYSPTMCIATFPFPYSDKLGLISNIGKSFNDMRHQILQVRGWGLTALAKVFNDTACCDPDVEELRKSFAELNYAVLNAYEWSDIDLKHGFHAVEYLPAGKNIRYTISEESRLELLKRLSVLNQTRYLEEKAEDLAVSSKSTVGYKKRPLKKTNDDPLIQTPLDF
jgi:hypothetical protein